MSQIFELDQTFDKVDFTKNPLPKGEYEGCTFLNCNFSESDLTRIQFEECVFKECNLSLAKTTNAVFRGVVFKDCKLLGVHFDKCNPLTLSVGFENCLLNLASFYKLGLKKTRFINCSLREADLSECDLTSAIFEQCDLSLTVFDNTVLEKADLRTSFNFSIDPTKNRIKKAKFTTSGLAGLLEAYELEID